MGGPPHKAKTINALKNGNLPLNLLNKCVMKLNDFLNKDLRQLLVHFNLNSFKRRILEPKNMKSNPRDPL